MKKLLLLITLFAGLSVIQLAQAEVVKGRIQTVSNKAGTVQIGVKDKKVVIRIDKNTRFEGFAGLNELSPPDLIEAEREPGTGRHQDQENRLRSATRRRGQHQGTAARS